MKRLLWIGLLLILLAGCSTAPQELHSTSLFAMDTVMSYIEKTKNNEEFLLSMNG